MRKLLASIGLLWLFAACIPDAVDRENERPAYAIGPATITTDAASYNYAQPITITWSGLNGNASDWIAIAPQGSALTVVTRWKSTGGTASGNTTIAGPNTGGTYVARAFDAGTYTLMGESDPFTVMDPGSTMATLTLNQPAYAMTDPITVNWVGLPGNALDWISIAPQGFPIDDQADWLYTGGGTSGSITFTDGLAPTGFPPGLYVARAYLNDTFTLVGESAPFAIGGAVTTNKSSYITNEPITVNWTNLPGNAQDWIALAPSGSSLTTVTRWVYTGGAVTGMTTFAFGLSAPGDYVARAFANNTYSLVGESAPFTVTTAAAVTVTTNAATYTLGQYITVSFTGLPGNATDWISIAPAGSSDTTVTRWKYSGGTSNGSVLLEGPVSPGMYVARAYQNNTYVKLGESLVFVVQ